MKGEDLTVSEQTTRNSQAFVLLWATLRISLKKNTTEVKFAEGKSAFLQKNNE